MIALISRKHKCPIEIKLSGGLGNQLFQLSHGISLALDHQRPLILLDQDYSIDSLRKYMLDNFAFKSGVAYYLTANQNSLEIESTAQNCDCKSVDILEKYFHFQNLEIPKQKIRLHGYWQSDLYFKNYTNQIKNYFTGFLEMQNFPAIDTLMHFRLGDMLNSLEINKVHGVLSLEYYQKALSVISNRSQIITCITDSPELIENYFLNSLRKTYPKVEFLVSESQSAIQDLSKISSSKNLVIANSTFSWWGAFLGISKSIVIAPRAHFSENSLREMNICDYFPKSWVLI